ncbi:hypothetical protein PQR02_31330, partial [Paraburkholderia sediminicola]|uniref:hypothetical protein n=1 Tax=Paraburkholderia sediminicola TaxID=458836 RepID=UPI0038BAA4B0
LPDCGIVELWNCGIVGLWDCGIVGLWDCGIAVFGFGFPAITARQQVSRSAPSRERFRGH